MGQSLGNDLGGSQFNSRHFEWNSATNLLVGQVLFADSIWLEVFPGILTTDPTSSLGEEGLVVDESHSLPDGHR